MCKALDIFVRFLTKFGVFEQTFAKCFNIKFHENPSCGSRADVCGRSDKETDRRS
jgi:hypothetical protein